MGSENSIPSGVLFKPGATCCCPAAAAFNWICLQVPGVHSNVVINFGTEIISNNVTIYSLNANPAATITVVVPVILVVTYLAGMLPEIKIHLVEKNQKRTQPTKQNTIFRVFNLQEVCKEINIKAHQNFFVLS